MTETASNIFVFVVLPLAFLTIWGYVIFYNRRIRRRIREIEGPGRHLDSMEAGIAAAMQDRSHKVSR